MADECSVSVVGQYLFALSPLRPVLAGRAHTAVPCYLQVRPKRCAYVEEESSGARCGEALGNATARVPSSGRHDEGSRNGNLITSRSPVPPKDADLDRAGPGGRCPCAASRQFSDTPAPGARGALYAT